jgi:NADPH:quinone reductase-like Zn-dependent oxidoreductase
MFDLFSLTAEPQSHISISPFFLHVESENSAEWSLIAEGEMDYVFDGVCQDGLEASRKALNKDGGRLVCFGQGHLIQGAEMGLFGAPLTAHYARFQNDFLFPNTTRLDIWESFENDPETYKVRVVIVQERSSDATCYITDA